MLPSEKQADIHRARAERLVEDGRFTDALEELAAAMRQDSRNGKVWLLLGDIYTMAGQLEPAASYLQKAVREDYTNMRTWTQLANIYCLLGGPYLELALEQIEMALGIDVNYADLHYLKGNVLGQLGDNAQAAESLHKALELQPGHIYATQDLKAVEA